MAVCKYCEREMGSADGCVRVPIKSKGKEYEPVKVGEEQRFGGEPLEGCGDCGAKKGHYHHPSCDMEECPVCHLQLIGCDCMDVKI